jgi:hypothetical protein
MHALAPDAVELDVRSGDGVNVVLLWHPSTDRLSISIDDERSGESLGFLIAADAALEAFHHPYAYWFGQRPRGASWISDDPVPPKRFESLA